MKTNNHETDVNRRKAYTIHITDREAGALRGMTLVDDPGHAAEIFVRMAIRGGRIRKAGVR